jgi:hypothetical protein
MAEAERASLQDIAASKGYRIPFKFLHQLLDADYRRSLTLCE